MTDNDKETTEDALTEGKAGKMKVRIKYEEEEENNESIR